MSTILESRRPIRPDAKLLQEALATVRPDGGTERLSWKIGPRYERPQSTVFPVTLTDDGSTVLRAYYKAHRCPAGFTPDRAAEKLRTFRRVLTRGPALRDEYTRLAVGVGVEMPRFLAVDVDRLLEVQAAMPGSPMPRVIMHATPGRRTRALAVYRALGKAIAVIERCEDVALAAEQPPELDAELVTKPLRPLIGEVDQRRLAGLLRELHDEACRGGGLSYSHGDVGRGNVFITPSSAGLIDALWSPRWRGDDIAYHAVRLDHELPRSPMWTARLVTEMLRGYGDESLPQRVEWMLTHLRFEIAVASPWHRRHPAASYQRRQAVQRIYAALGTRAH